MVKVYCCNNIQKNPNRSCKTEKLSCSFLQHPLKQHLFFCKILRCAQNDRGGTGWRERDVAAGAGGLVQGSVPRSGMAESGQRRYTQPKAVGKKRRYDAKRPVPPPLSVSDRKPVPDRQQSTPPEVFSENRPSEEAKSSWFRAFL